MTPNLLGKILLGIGIAFLVSAVFLLIFVDTVAIAICFVLSILFNVAGLTLLTAPGSKKTVRRRIP